MFSHVVMFSHVKVMFSHVKVMFSHVQVMFSHVQVMFSHVCFFCAGRLITDISESRVK